MHLEFAGSGSVGVETSGLGTFVEDLCELSTHEHHHPGDNVALWCLSELEGKECHQVACA